MSSDGLTASVTTPTGVTSYTTTRDGSIRIPAMEYTAHGGSAHCSVGPITIAHNQPRVRADVVATASSSDSDSDSDVHEPVSLDGSQSYQPPATATPARHIQVRDSAGLRAALATAQPGDTIVLAAGTYVGPFAANARSGGSDRLITIKGTNGAVIEPGDDSPVLLLAGKNWRLSGPLVINGT